MVWFKRKKAEYEIISNEIPMSTILRWYLYDTGLDDANKLAEFVGAYLLGHKLVDANGYDTQKGNDKVEIKWSFLNRSLNADGNPHSQATFSNLSTKSCRLMVFVCDDYLPPSHKDHIRIFLFPVKVWKEYWKGNKGSMSFGSDQKKWYKEYRIEF